MYEPRVYLYLYILPSSLISGSVLPIFRLYIKRITLQLCIFRNSRVFHDKLALPDVVLKIYSNLKLASKGYLS